MGRKSDTQLNIRVERALSAEAKIAAYRKGKTLSELIRAFLQALVKGTAG